ncbi:hypothetical protein WME90_28760 [Sorangium sp. So ce375]|uniref:hypothetical protein n=1 Tax=Sorangium sp. So ce375 TaxID=3133306 RepID=UPI003F5C7E3F
MNNKKPMLSKKHVANAAGMLALMSALTGATEAKAGRVMEVQLEQERLLQLFASAGEAAADLSCPSETQIDPGDPTLYLLEYARFRDASGSLLPGAMITRDESAPDSGLSGELPFVATFKSVKCAETPGCTTTVDVADLTATFAVEFDGQDMCVTITSIEKGVVALPPSMFGIDDSPICNALDPADLAPVAGDAPIAYAGISVDGSADGSVDPGDRVALRIVTGKLSGLPLSQSAFYDGSALAPSLGTDWSAFFDFGLVRDRVKSGIADANETLSTMQMPVDQVKVALVEMADGSPRLDLQLHADVNKVKMQHSDNGDPNSCGSEDNWAFGMPCEEDSDCGNSGYTCVANRCDDYCDDFQFCIGDLDVDVEADVQLPLSLSADGRHIVGSGYVDLAIEEAQLTLCLLAFMVPPVEVGNGVAIANEIVGNMKFAFPTQEPLTFEWVSTPSGDKIRASVSIPVPLPALEAGHATATLKATTLAVADGPPDGLLPEFKALLVGGDMDISEPFPAPTTLSTSDFFWQQPTPCNPIEEGYFANVHVDGHFNNLLCGPPKLIDKTGLFSVVGPPNAQPAPAGDETLPLPVIIGLEAVDDPKTFDPSTPDPVIAVRTWGGNVAIAVKKPIEVTQAEKEAYAAEHQFDIYDCLDIIAGTPGSFNPKWRVDPPWDILPIGLDLEGRETKDVPPLRLTEMQLFLSAGAPMTARDGQIRIDDAVLIVQATFVDERQQEKVVAAGVVTTGLWGRLDERTGLATLTASRLALSLDVEPTHVPRGLSALHVDLAPLTDRIELTGG